MWASKSKCRDLSLMPKTQIPDWVFLVHYTEPCQEKKSTLNAKMLAKKQKNQIFLTARSGSLKWWFSIISLCLALFLPWSCHASHYFQGRNEQLLNFHVLTQFYKMQAGTCFTQNPNEILQSQFFFLLFGSVIYKLCPPKNLYFTSSFLYLFSYVRVLCMCSCEQL